MRLVAIVILVILLRHNFMYYKRLKVKRLLTKKDYVILFFTLVLLVLCGIAVKPDVINYVIIIMVGLMVLSGLIAQGFTDEGVLYFEGLKVSPVLVPFDKIKWQETISIDDDKIRVIFDIPQRTLIHDYFQAEYLYIEKLMHLK